MKILLIEDDKLLGKAIKDYLGQNGFEVEWFSQVETSSFAELASAFDIAVIDWLLGTVSGIDIVTKIRKEGITLPIIMITVKSSLEDKLEGFSHGIDDYITKPFYPEELLARIRAVMQRYYGTNNTLSTNNLIMNLDKKEVTIDGTPINLTNKEFNLLKVLLQRKGKVLSYDFLIDYVWGENGSYETLKSHIYMLRKKLKKDIIKSIKGFGYKID